MILKDFKMSFRAWEDIACTAPCSMYSVLYDNGYIPDPFYGTNELELRHLSEDDCDFYTVFSLCEEEVSKAHNELVYYGLDTICDIKLNGVQLARVIRADGGHGVGGDQGTLHEVDTTVKLQNVIKLRVDAEDVAENIGIEFSLILDVVYGVNGLNGCEILEVGVLGFQENDSECRLPIVGVQDIDSLTRLFDEFDDGS